MWPDQCLMLIMYFDSIICENKLTGLFGRIGVLDDNIDNRLDLYKTAQISICFQFSTTR